MKNTYQNDVTNDEIDQSHTWYQKIFLQNVPRISSNNYIHDNHFVKIKLFPLKGNEVVK